MKTIIAPSLLSCDFVNIEKEVSYFKDCKDFWFHLDVMDGHFVPNMTFGHPIIKRIRQITDLPLDAHCMVSNPEFYIDTFKEYNLQNFTFHIEATEDVDQLIKKAKEFFPSVGVSIKPNTAVSQLTMYALENIDLLLVMSVEPGFGGQSFIENTFNKLSEIKKLKDENGYQFQVQVDGGVSDQNAQKLVEYGCNNLVAGSYVFKPGPKEYINRVDSLRF